MFMLCSFVVILDVFVIVHADFLLLYVIVSDVYLVEIPGVLNKDFKDCFLNELHELIKLCL